MWSKPQGVSTPQCTYLSTNSQNFDLLFWKTGFRLPSTPSRASTSCMSSLTILLLTPLFRPSRIAALRATNLAFCSWSLRTRSRRYSLLLVKSPLAICDFIHSSCFSVKVWCWYSSALSTKCHYKGDKLTSYPA